MSWPYAPFRCGTPVYDDDHFVNRERLIGELQDMIRAPDLNAFILRGPRRAGKSSILKRLGHLLADEANVVHLDMLDILGQEGGAPSSVAPLILAELCNRLGVDPRPFFNRSASGWNSIEDLPYFRRSALPKLCEAANGRRLVVLLDELEVAEARDPRAPREIAAALQPLGSLGTPSPFLGIVWGRPLGQGLVREIPDILKDFQARSLVRFGQKDCAKALSQPIRGLYNWSDEAAARVWDLTNGHPLFIAAMATAIHAAKISGNTSEVLADDVDDAIEEALSAGQSWGDAWRQTDAVQRLFLRALSEEPGPTSAEQILQRLQEWGSPFEKRDLAPRIKGLVEDELIAEDKDGRYRFQVEMIRRWILRNSVQPDQLVAGAVDGRHRNLGDAAESERDGRRFYVAGEFEEAVIAFKVALDIDPDHSPVAVWLGDALIKLNRPEEAAQSLRIAPPTAEVRQVRAVALSRCAEKALNQGEDPSAWLDELRRVDPYFLSAPHAEQLAARFAAEEWWQAVMRLEKRILTEATDRYALTNAPSISAALQRGRAGIEAAHVHAAATPELLFLVSQAMPYLLRESERRTKDREKLRAEWDLAYIAELRALRSICEALSGPHDQAFPFDALLALTACEATATPIGEPLRKLILAQGSQENLVTLIITDPKGAKDFSAILLRLGDAESHARLLDALNYAALAASEGNNMSMLAALRTFPAVAANLGAVLGAVAPTMRKVSSGEILEGAELLFDRLETDPNCGTIFLEPDEFAAWQAFFDLPLLADQTGLSRIRAKFDQWRIGGRPTVIEASDYRDGAESLQALLGSAYSVERQVPFRIHGVGPGYVRAWNVDRQGKPLLARVYQIAGGEPVSIQFLQHLWEHERRLLSGLATQWEGRALPQLHVARFDQVRSRLVLVTDRIGPKSLRGLLASGEIATMRKVSRARLWRQLNGLIAAIAGMHRSGYIHRGVRPENVLVDFEVETGAGGDQGRQWLRLANFEWSIYLYSLPESRARGAGARDRYAPTERFEGKGEGVSSDLFGLGLLLFECLVEPLSAAELDPTPPTYSADDHRAWVGQILNRVDDAMASRSLSIREVELLKNLLKTDNTRRLADIEAVVELAGPLSLEETSAQAERGDKLQLVTTLQSGTPESITSFIRQSLPDFDRSGDAAARWLENQLHGAQVFPNKRAESPLLVLGREINFTVQPFYFQGDVFRHIGWLKIAQADDLPAGPLLFQIRHGVEVHSYRRDLRVSRLLRSSASWEAWFDETEGHRQGLNNNERAFVDRVRWSVELERKSWEQHVAPYQLEDYEEAGRPGQPEYAVVRGRGDGQDLVHPDYRPREWNPETFRLSNMMAQAADRETTFFELSDVRDPTAAFRPGFRWSQDALLDDGSVRLKRYRQDDSRNPPKTGWIRPYSLAGHRALYQRHKEVLDEIRQDPFLVRSVLTPEAIFDDLNLKPVAPVNPKLDADKIALADAIQNRRPIFVVQGPPGTGKTTLAAEVVLRTLLDNPSSRILIVAQAHDPLNNLLERVESELDKQRWPGGSRPRPTSVRLTSEERLDERRYGSESVRVPKRFHPSVIAAKGIERALAWQPGDGDVKPETIRLWREMFASQALHGVSRSLEQRLVASANLVYATANDRRLAALRPGSFDLLIYEETAKALPVEVLGPMRLARRWLLIGDQNQLPPFGLKDVESALKSRLDDLRHAGAAAEGVDPKRILGDVAATANQWDSIYGEMANLFRFFDYLYKRAAKVPLLDGPVGGRQTTGDEAAGASDAPKAGAVSGLSGLLKTQWRMHPVIGSFVSRIFYRNEVQNGDPESLSKWRRHGLIRPHAVKDKAILWLDAPSAVDQALAGDRPGFGGGYENGYEARVVVGFLRELLATRSALSVAILSPYRAQVRALGKLMKDFKFGDGGQILLENLHTADSFQGKQADIVIVSMVRNNRAAVDDNEESAVRRGLGFLEEAERSTVIFSRAERLLVVVGSLDHFKSFHGTKMRLIAEDIERLAGNPNSGVDIVPADDFIDDRHWAALEKHHQSFERRSGHGDNAGKRP